MVEITGWDCSKGEPIAATNCGGITKRDAVGGASVTQGTFFEKQLSRKAHFGKLTDQDDFFTNFTDSRQNALMLYLGDVSPGV